MSAWDSAPILEDQSEAWKSAPLESEPKPKSIFKQAKDAALASGFLPAPLAASVEGALALGTGFGGMLAGGIGGLGRTLMSGPEEGAKASQRIASALTYQPDSPTVQKVLGKVGGVVDKFWSDPNRRAGGIISEKTGMPALGAAYVGAMEAAPNVLGMPEAAAARNVARVAALKDPAKAAAVAAREAGFVLPPSQVTPWSLTSPKSWINNLVEGAGGTLKLKQELSAKNQQVMQQKIRQQLGLEADAPLDLDTYAAKRGEHGEAYNNLREAGWGAPRTEIPAPVERARTSAILDENGRPLVSRETTQAAPFERTPGLEVNDSFRASVKARADAIRAQLTESEPTFAALKPSLELLDDAVSKAEIHPGIAVDRIKQLRADAKSDFASRDPAKVETARTRLGLANDLEGLIEQNLTEKGDTTSLARFREARKGIAQTYTAEKATLASGEIYAKALAEAKKKGIPLEGGMADIANLGANFEKATQIPSRVGGTPAISPLDVASAVLGHSVGGDWLGAAYAAARAPARAIAKSDWYQRLMVAPPSGPSLGSRVVQGLQQPGAIPGLESLGLDPRREEMLRQLLAQEGAVQ